MRTDHHLHIIHGHDLEMNVLFCGNGKVDDWEIFKYYEEKATDYE